MYTQINKRKSGIEKVMKYGKREEERVTKVLWVRGAN